LDAPGLVNKVRRPFRGIQRPSWRISMPTNQISQQQAVKRQSGQEKSKEKTDLMEV